MHLSVLPVVRVPGGERRLLKTMQLAIGEFITDSSQGLGLQAEHLGARPGSLDWGRMLFGTKGKRTGNSTGAQAGLEKSSVNPGPAVRQEGVWRRKSSVNPEPCCEAGRCLAQEVQCKSGALL